MVHNGVVVSSDGTRCRVRITDSAVCSGCAERGGPGCPGCISFGGNKEFYINAVDRTGASVGDTVRVRTHDGGNVLKALMIFLLPVAMMIAGYLIGSLMGLGEGMRVLAAFTGFAVVAVAAAVVAKAENRKHEPEVIAPGSEDESEVD